GAEHGSVVDWAVVACRCYYPKEQCRHDRQDQGDRFPFDGDEGSWQDQVEDGSTDELVRGAEVASQGVTDVVVELNGYGLVEPIALLPQGHDLGRDVAITCHQANRVARREPGGYESEEACREQA